MPVVKARSRAWDQRSAHIEAQQRRWVAGGRVGATVGVGARPMTTGVATRMGVGDGAGVAVKALVASVLAWPSPSVHAEGNAHLIVVAILLDDHMRST